jgi:glycosyltransferase involved in cell wall biosynthesis
MRKILFHINSLGKGGAERVVSVLSDYFANDGYDVVIATLWQDKQEYVLNPKVRRIEVGLSTQQEKKGRIYKNLVRFLNLRNAIKNENPDIVISFCASANFRCTTSMLGINIPLLVSVRNDPQKDYLPYMRKTNIMMRKASGCVFQTDRALKCFPKAFGDKSKVIFNPLDEKFLSNQDDVKVEDREKRIVTVGRITKQKNHMLLVQAFEKIHNLFPQYTLDIYGESDDHVIKDEIVDYCKKTNIDKYVRFMGLSSTLQKDIKDAALFVLSSDYEGMPNALAEAMALGLPVIATDCPCYGPATLISNNKSGILVPVGDVDKMAEAISKVLGDEIFAQELGNEAMKIKDILNPDKIYKEWKEYVNNIIEQHNSK